MELITTDDMVEYVKSRMGYPVTEIEMVVEERGGLGHIHLAIKDTLDWFYRINMDEASYKDIMKIPLRAGIIQYRVPDNIMEVIDVQPSYHGIRYYQES